MGGGIALYMGGSSSFVSADAFVKAADRLLRILGDVEKGMSPKGQSEIVWGVGSLGSGSAHAEFVPVVATMLPYDGGEVARAVVQGLAALEKETRRPPYFTEQALRWAGELAGVAGRDVKELRVSVDNLTVDLTPTLSRHVDELFATTVEELGTVEGTLKMISVAGRQPQYNVYDCVTGVAVTCTFDLRSQDVITAAFGRRVAVSGLVSYSIDGYPRRVRDVSSILVFPSDDELPTSMELLEAGIDLGGGLSVEEFAEEKHHGGW